MAERPPALLAGSIVPCYIIILITSYGMLNPSSTQVTNSWPLVFGITAAHYLIGSIVWVMWVGDKALPEDDLGDVDSNK